MSDRITLKSYFETGDVPTEAQFADLIDSVGLLTEVNAKQDALTFGTSGQIPFTNATGDDYLYTSNLVWDNANSRLGIGTASPRNVLDVANGNISWGTNALTATYLNIPNGSILGWSSAAVHYGLGLNKQAWFGYGSSANFIFSTTGQVVVGGTIALSGSPKFGVKGRDNTTGVNTLLTSLDGTELFKVTNDGNITFAGGVNRNWDFINAIQAEHSAIYMGLGAISTTLGMASNMYYDGTWRAMKTGTSMLFQFKETDFRIFKAASVSAGANVSLVKIFECRSDGNINMANLPTSSAGLSSGDIWNDGGTLKIV